MISHWHWPSYQSPLDGQCKPVSYSGVHGGGIDEVGNNMGVDVSAAGFPPVTFDVEKCLNLAVTPLAQKLEDYGNASLSLI